jgi:hypothetical protein
MPQEASSIASPRLSITPTKDVKQGLYAVVEAYSLNRECR